MGIEDRIILKMYLWKIGCDVEDSTELHKDGIWWRRVHDHSNKTQAHERQEVSWLAGWILFSQGLSILHEFIVFLQLSNLAFGGEEGGIMLYVSMLSFII